QRQEHCGDDSSCCHEVPRLGLARIIHERFCCNRGFAATTSLAAGVLAAQSFDVLFQVRLSPLRLCLPVSQRDSTISQRTAMNKAG
ncbi:MAG: hypothetical protein ACREVM_08310, partial [Burkholderiales bacterium]